MSDEATPSESPASVEIDKPNAARIYDYMLGGSHNFEVDRKFADDMMAATNSTPRSYRMNRSFLRRAVKFMVERGVDQFLDLGSGIPTVGKRPATVSHSAMGELNRAGSLSSTPARSRASASCAAIDTSADASTKIIRARRTARQRTPCRPSRQ